MVRRLQQHQRGQGEDGSALALALAFLVLFSVIIAVVLSFASTSLLSSTHLASQRDTLYAENGAVDAAITRVRNDTTKALGGSGSDCGQQVQASGATVSVACNSQANSGLPQGSTQAPGFAILSLSPYHGPNPNNGCVNVNNELGIVQVQSKKLLTINGNVYINADIDSDLWSGGCPQITTAQHPLVNGNAIHRESANDLDCAAGFTCAQPVPNPTPAQAALLADPAIANPTAWAPGVDANLTTPPAVQTVPACGSSSIVQFNPGTYNDATAFNALMNGSCPNKLFYFAPGNYYFDFTNAGTHEWSINDVTARIVGGQPYNGASTGSVIVGPTTWQPTATGAGVSGSVAFTTPANATVIDGNSATATINTGQTASMSLSTYRTNPASVIPSNAVVNTVRVRVADAESGADADPATVLNRVGAPTINVTSGATQCGTSFPVTKRSTLGEDAAPSYDVTSCLNTPNLVNNGIKITYSVPKCAAGGTCDTTAANLRLDGIWLDITYTLPGRAAWNPANPATVTATSPLVPGACYHDGDGAAWTNGTQFVFGGDSRVNLRLGKLELCDKPATTHQEIVLYGVKSGTGSTSVGPVTLAAVSSANPPSPTTSSPGFGTPLSQAVAIDGTSSATATFSTSNQTEWITTSGYAMSGAQQIPGNATGLTTQLRIVHLETGNSTGFQNLQVFVRDAADANTLCTVPVTRSTSSADVTLAVPANCLTATMLNTGAFTLRYSVQHNTCSGGGCGLISTALDGIQLKVSYSVPNAGTNLHGATGCITQTPYYSPTDHSPAYQGACAVLTVNGNPNQIGNDPTTWNVAALWGTVYVPSAALDIQPYDLQVPVFNRGFAARMAMLGYNPTGNAVVPITVSPTVQTIVANRRMTFTATVPGKSTSVVADVEFCDSTCSGTTQTQSGDVPIKIYSWKVTR